MNKTGFCFSVFFLLTGGLLFISVCRAGSSQIIFDFESGDLTREGWAVVEGENSRPVGSRDSIFHTSGPYPKQGRFYLTTLESSAGPKTFESNCCVLESPVFRLTDQTFRFRIGGGNIPQTWLALCELKPDGSVLELRQFRGVNRQTMDQITLDLGEYLGKPLLFRLIDRDKGAWSYLHADAFFGTGSIDRQATDLRRTFMKNELIKQGFAKTERTLDALIRRLRDLQESESNDHSDSSESFNQSTDVLSVHAPKHSPQDPFSSASAVKRGLKLQQELKQIAAPTLSIKEFDERWKRFQDQFNQFQNETVRHDPLLSQSLILYVSRPPFPYEHHNTETTYQNDEICTEKFPSGSSLRVWNAKTGNVHSILDVPNGIVRDPCVHFDGKRILVSVRWEIKDDFHIYELDLRGKDPETVILTRSDLKQLTAGSDLSDIDPQYLPDGRIVFSSTREPKYCMCNRHIMCNLHTMNGDGSNLLQIGHSTLYEGHSSLLPDGRILYYRWEYVDRNFSDAQGVWVTNPDGTNHALFWGNNTESPAANVDPRIMPGSSSLFVCTMIACHTPAWGAIGLIDRTKGLDGIDPVVQVWPPDAWDLIGTYNGKSYDNLTKLSQRFEDPFPLDEHYLLAAGTIPSGTMLPGKMNKKSGSPSGATGIWFLDIDGGMRLIHTDPIGCFDPMPLAPSEAPPVITDRIDLSKDNGYFYVTNVREGFGMKDVPDGSIKYLRVIESPEKRFWNHPSWVGVDYKGNQQAPAMNWDEFGNKRILGTVPIEKDGSVYFSVPADTFVFFQILDENRQMIQSMRSGVIVRPGETNGCFGCHEDRLETPVSSRITLAMRKKPQELVPEFNRRPFLFSYTETVQPILDKYCVACHDRPTSKSSPIARRAAGKVLLCGDLNTVFNCSYWEIRDKKLVNVIGSAFAEKIKPLVWGSSKSRLLEIMRAGHDQGGPIDSLRKEKGLFPVDPFALDMTAAWIDMNAPYYSVFSTNYPDNPYGRSPLTFSEMKELADLTGRHLPGNEMAAGRKPDPILDHDVSFSRPEMSPCLDRWPDPESQKRPEYRRSLEIIKIGQERLAKTPRADMPNWKMLNPEDLKREKKYQAFKIKAQKMKEAALKGEKLYDCPPIH